MVLYEFGSTMTLPFSISRSLIDDMNMVKCFCQTELTVVIFYSFFDIMLFVL